MRTRRSVLVSVGGLIALAGCSQQASQPAEEPDADTASSETDTGSSELSIEEFRIAGESPEEYETEFLRGSTPEQVADELQPELSYKLAGVQGQVETEVQFEYSDRTIPEGEPLNETVEGDTHEGNGEYTQTPGLPDGIAEEMLENPKNLVVTFRATDTESGETKTKEYELNFADSYIEAAYESQFSRGNYAVTDANLEKVEADDGIISISFESRNDVGSQPFKNEIGNIAGGYSVGVKETRVPYELELAVSGSNGDEFRKTVNNDYANQHLNGELNRGQLSRAVLFEKLLEN